MEPVATAQQGITSAAPNAQRLAGFDGQHCMRPVVRSAELLRNSKVSRMPARHIR